MKRTGFTPKIKPLPGILRTANLSAPGKPKLTAKPRTRKCATCRTPFRPINALRDKWCSPECGASLALRLLDAKKKKELRAERKALAERKEAAKPLQKRLKETEEIVNRYVRVRDRHLGCISCDKPAHWDGQWHASHFKSVGSNSVLRYNLWNIHKACSQCNWYMAGNIAEYEKRLSLKIGAERVEWLKCQNGVRKYEAEYLDRMKKIFTKKVKRVMGRNQ